MKIQHFFLYKIIYLYNKQENYDLSVELSKIKLLAQLTYAAYFLSLKKADFLSITFYCEFIEIRGCQIL